MITNHTCIYFKQDKLIYEDFAWPTVSLSITAAAWLRRHFKEKGSHLDLQLQTVLPWSIWLNCFSRPVVRSEAQVGGVTFDGMEKVMLSGQQQERGWREIPPPPWLHQTVNQQRSPSRGQAVYDHIIRSIAKHCCSKDQTFHTGELSRNI